ncbi:MAG: hypothetical protein JAZ03_20260 [Candidatus Thiodiazotropha taylori]|nr:hypothetical protein [Candidatus Thiodiazotropha taylori]MCW4336262.1 hypothetical protein [Candidatus Thiodiazotropha endolucinida]
MSANAEITSELKGFERCLALIDGCEFPEAVKLELKDFITWGEFWLLDHEPCALFNILERFALLNVVAYMTKVGLCESCLQEVKQHLKEITNYLISNFAYGADVLTRPSTLYMRCLKNIVLRRQGTLQATVNDRSIPRLMRFHINYYGKLHINLEMFKVEQIGLPWEVIEDLYTLKDLNDLGKAESPMSLYEILERGVVYDVVPRLRWGGAAENFIELMEIKYRWIRRSLLEIHFGYDLLNDERPEFFERSLHYVMRNIPMPYDFTEMAARLRRIITFHQEYYEDLFAFA